MKVVLSRIVVSALGSCLILGCSCRKDFVEDNEIRDEVLQKYFTPEAVERLSQVPFRIGDFDINIGNGLSVGNDLGSQLAASLSGYPWGRQVILKPSFATEYWIFHEYMHQAQYSGFVSRREFNDVFRRLKDDSEYSQDAIEIEEDIIDDYNDSIGTWMALRYNFGLAREMIAYISDHWIFKGYEWPEYFLSVYSRSLKLDEIAVGLEEPKIEEAERFLEASYSAEKWVD